MKVKLNNILMFIAYFLSPIMAWFVLFISLNYRNGFVNSLRISNGTKFLVMILFFGVAVFALVPIVLLPRIRANKKTATIQ